MPHTSDTASQKSARGRPALISLDQIADAALRIGLRDLTMMSLGTELNVRHSTLYRYVKDRDDVIRIAVVRAIGQLNWKKTEADWKSEAFALGHAFWDLFSATPSLAEISQDPKYQSAAGSAAFCDAVEHFVSLGFDEMDAAVFLDSLFDMTADMVATLERFEHFAEQSGSLFQETVPSPESDAQIGLMQRVMEAITTDPKAWWHRKISLLISGAEQQFLKNGQ